MMLSWYFGLALFILLLGGCTLAWQVYHMTELDARCRGFRHPRAWGLFSLGGNNSSGLLLYLLGRRSYPAAYTDSDRAQLEARKKRAGVSLGFLAAGAILCAAILIFEL